MAYDILVDFQFRIELNITDSESSSTKNSVEKKYGMKLTFALEFAQIREIVSFR